MFKSRKSGQFIIIYYTLSNIGLIYHILILKGNDVLKIKTVSYNALFFGHLGEPIELKYSVLCILLFSRFCFSGRTSVVLTVVYNCNSIQLLTYISAAYYRAFLGENCVEIMAKGAKLFVYMKSGGSRREEKADLSEPALSLAPDATRRFNILVLRSFQFLFFCRPYPPLLSSGSFLPDHNPLLTGYFVLGIRLPFRTVDTNRVAPVHSELSSELLLQFLISSLSSSQSIKLLAWYRTP